MQLEVGQIYEGRVTGVTKFGAFVSFENNQTGMVHISEVAAAFVNEIKDFVTEGQTVKVKVLSISDDGKISLSIKKALDPQPGAPKGEFQRRGNRGDRDQNQRPRQRFPRRPAEPQPGPARPGDYEWQARTNEGGSFEDMMSKFKQNSDEKMSDLKRGNETKRGYSRRGSQH